MAGLVMLAGPEANSDQASGDQPLPELRQDLEYLQQGNDPHGAPTWVVYDPLQHRYIRIDYQTYQLLQLWPSQQSIGQMAVRARNDAGLMIDSAQCEALVRFAAQHGLCSTSSSAASGAGPHGAKAAGRHWVMSLAERYLFFKVPLVRPQAFLQACLPYVALLYHWITAWLVAVVGVAGTYLVLQQWDRFVATATDMASISGAAWFLVALIIIKSLHELGHALTAARYGLHVPAMGVAFMVLAPILYTDVTDAWRLSSRRRRIAIHAAGVVVELSIACLALLAWAFLPDGPLRVLAFAMATTGLALTLIINLNPFMRFDGYFVFSELIGVDNLQPRSFALGRWKLRQLLFAPSLRPPETLPGRLRTLLVAYAWGTWVYRLFLFTAIALIVYAMFFKALGILLFALEIWLLIIRPIAREIQQWRGLGQQVDIGWRATMTCAIAALAFAALFMPLSNKVEVPAILEAGDSATIYPPRAAQMATLNFRPGDWVAEGADLARLHDPKLEHEIAVARNRLQLNRLHLERVALDADDREQRVVLENEAASLRAKLEGLLRERDELTIRAPISGRIYDVPRELHAGQWVAKTLPLATIAAPDSMMARGYVLDSDLGRLQSGAKGSFISDQLTFEAVAVQLRRLADSAERKLKIEDLASPFGGGAVASQGEDKKLIPVRPYYLAEFTVDKDLAAPGQTVRGVIQLDGAAESIAGRIWRLLARVLIRESGF